MVYYFTQHGDPTPNIMLVACHDFLFRHNLMILHANVMLAAHHVILAVRRDIIVSTKNTQWSYM